MMDLLLAIFGIGMLLFAWFYEAPTQKRIRQHRDDVAQRVAEYEAQKKLNKSD